METDVPPNNPPEPPAGTASLPSTWPILRTPPSNNPPESSVGAAFVASNKAAAVLSRIMLTAWSVYYTARRDLQLLASQSFTTTEDSDLAIGQIVQAMQEKAKLGGMADDEALSGLQEIVLPYMSDLVSRKVAINEAKIEEIPDDGQDDESN